MMISEMIEVLEGMLEDGDRELRIATQQNWPFENSIRGIVEGRDLVDEDRVKRPTLESLSVDDLIEIAEIAGIEKWDGKGSKRRYYTNQLHGKYQVEDWLDENFGTVEMEEENKYKDYVYIIEGKQIGYFTKDAWDNC